MASSPEKKPVIQAPSARTQFVASRVPTSRDNYSLSKVQITTTDFSSGGNPVSNGPIGGGMGATSHGHKCDSCGLPESRCTGHAGNIGSMQGIPYPVKIPSLVELIRHWMMAICRSCYKPILSDTELVPTKPEDRFAKCHTANSRPKNCARCGEPSYKTTAGSDGNRADLETNAPLSFAISDMPIASIPKDLLPWGSNKTRPLLNLEIEEFFGKITLETVTFLGKSMHPSALLWRVIPIAPNSLRPEQLQRRTGKNPLNAITVVLINTIQNLPQKITSRDIYDGTVSRSALADLDNVHAILAFGNPTPQKSGKPTSSRTVNVTASSGFGGGSQTTTSFVSLLGKKEGFVRGNAAGWRCGFTARFVIIGDPRASVGEVIMSDTIAMKITVPETVNENNIDRLTQNFINGYSKWPGCKNVIREGKMYDVRYNAKTFQLREGDVLLRHAITGDIVSFNRPPSLLDTNHSGHKLRIIKNSEIKSPFGTHHVYNVLGMSLADCQAYNADFDGDAMILAIPQTQQGMADMYNLMGIPKKLISRRDPRCGPGAFQDSLQAATKMTMSTDPKSDDLNAALPLSRYIAMSMFGNIKPMPGQSLQFGDSENVRTTISKILPPVNYKGTSTIFNPAYVGSIADTAPGRLPYRKDSMTIRIKNGELLSGVLGKRAVGQSGNGIFMQALSTNKLSPEDVIRCIGNMHRISEGWLSTQGMTCGIADLFENPETRKLIRMINQRKVTEAKELYKQAIRGDLTPPLGVTLEDYYTSEIWRIMGLTDDEMKAVFSDLDLGKNGVGTMVVGGIKGKPANWVSIRDAVGMQTYQGGPATFNFDGTRISPFFQGGDRSPEAMGYVPDSYKDGIRPENYLPACCEGRDGVVSNAMKAPTAGSVARDMNMALQGAMPDNRGTVMDNGRIIQMLAGNTGFDGAKLNYAKVPFVLMSNDDFRAKLYYDDDEYKRLLEARSVVREAITTEERVRSEKYVANPKLIMPVDMQSLIREVKNGNEIPGAKFDAKASMAIVDEFCNDLPYIYMNAASLKNKTLIPPQYESAVAVIRAYFRISLCVKELQSAELSTDHLVLVLKEAWRLLIHARIPAGQALGLYVAEYTSEAITQYALDSKHRVGVTSEATNPIIRIGEVLNARPSYAAPKKPAMESPSMIIFLKEEYRQTYDDAAQIANAIESRVFEQFIVGASIYYEPFGEVTVAPTRSKNPAEVERILAREKSLFKVARKYATMMDSGATPAGRAKRGEARDVLPIHGQSISGWCMRFMLDPIKIRQKSITVSEIVRLLTVKFGDSMWFMATPDRSDIVWIRGYVRITRKLRAHPEIFKKSMIIKLYKQIRSETLSGVPRILGTRVVQMPCTVEMPDGSLQMEQQWAIRTTGTNLMEILMFEAVDPTRTVTNCVKETVECCGITAGRNALQAEMMNVLDLGNSYNVSLIANMMTCTGVVTPINANGIATRDPEEFLRLMLVEAPHNVVRYAAANNAVTEVTGALGPLVMGSIGSVGSTYNTIIIDENRMKKTVGVIAEQYEDMF